VGKRAIGWKKEGKKAKGEKGQANVWRGKKIGATGEGKTSPPGKVQI